MSRGSGPVRLNGLSRSIISHTFRGRKRLSNVLAAGGQAQRIAAADASRRAEIQGMSDTIFIMLLSTMILHQRCRWRTVMQSRI
jgi:hypothetical protein